MAPRGVKRSNSNPASPKKKGRVDPAFAGIISTLQETDDLSDKCREMLIAMVTPSLSTYKSERHSMQQMGVEMIEEKLLDHKQKLAAAVEKAKKDLADLEGSKTSLSSNLDGAKALAEEKKNASDAANTAHQEAKAAVKEAEKALAASKTAQKKGDANAVKTEKEKAAMQSAYDEHFKAPMDANEAPHHDDLKPFIESLGLEDSLTKALPSSCAKAKEQRGNFDDVVIGELGKALEKKLAELTASIANEATAVEERKAAITSAEATLEARRAAEWTAGAAREAAADAKKEADNAVTKANEDWTTFEPRVQEATATLAAHEATRIDFDEGPLKDFNNLKDKEAPAPVEEEAAPAGA